MLPSREQSTLTYFAQPCSAVEERRRGYRAVAGYEDALQCVFENPPNKNERQGEI
jgi:hypothetical protein